MSVEALILCWIQLDYGYCVEISLHFQQIQDLLEEFVFHLAFRLLIDTHFHGLQRNDTVPVCEYVGRRYVRRNLGSQDISSVYVGVAFGSLPVEHQALRLQQSHGHFELK